MFHTPSFYPMEYLKYLLVFACFFFSQGLKASDSNDKPFDHTHANWDSVLQKHVVFKGSSSWVDYAGLKAEQSTFRSYLSALEAVSKEQYQTFTKDQKLAFLINTYNARQVQLIIDNYPLDSVKDLGFLLYTPWRKDFFMLFGKITNLDYVEHGLIRKQFQEPRIHFAVNCASIGCPPLLNHAYTAAKLEAQLEENTFRFLNNPAHNFYSKTKETLVISPIFDWYDTDFGTEEMLIKFVGDYMTSLSHKDKIDDIKYSDYDWDLNDLASLKKN